MLLRNYIDGTFAEPIHNDTIAVINPSTGETIHHVVNSSEIEINLAVDAAERAFSSWSLLSSEIRSDYLMAIAGEIEKRFEEFALAESTDSGKPLSLTRRMDIPRAIQNLKFFAHAATQFSSEFHDSPGNQSINYTLRSPLGAVVCISPWNLPLYLFTWKIAPALAAGNTVIAKPSEVTPLTAYLLSEACIKAGLPKGVLNIIHGKGEFAGNALISHKKIKAVSFTGSTKVGSHIAQVCSSLFRKVSLEMGGKNPVIIFDDCNYEKMLQTVVRSSFTNQGQICLCGSRIYIQKSIYEKFKTDFVTETKKMIVGDPLNENTNIGAIVSKLHYDKILSYLMLAKEEGGQILCGGEAIKIDGLDNGLFIAPTIIEGLSNGCRTNQEEIFGPVVTIAPFDDDNEVVLMANESSYGLACSIWTENISRAHRLARAINTGIVWINTWLNRDLRTPFGGMKDSGVGREGGLEAMRFFTEAKNVCIQY